MNGMLPCEVVYTQGFTGQNIALFFVLFKQTAFSSLQNVFNKGYLSQWSKEIFKIIDRKRFTDKNLYKVEDLLGEEVSGFFYELELQKVGYPKVFRIEKILKSRKIGSKTEYFVKWLGYPQKFNTWVNKTDLGNEKRI